MKSIFFVSIIFVLFSCQNRSQNNAVIIQKDNVKKLEKKYSVEAFNYLYEIGFHTDSYKEEITIKKWKTDIKYFIQGDTLPNDTKYVENCIEKLNNINLPIKFSIVNDIKDSNVVIYFGDRISLKHFEIPSNVLGQYIPFVKNRVIYKGQIVIFDQEKRPLKRESLLLEEMTQIIGSCDDSYSYPKSAFYEADNTVLEFTKLDIEVMKLAYDPLIPVNYSLGQYEKDFGSILRYVNVTSKLKKCIEKNKITRETLEAIKNTCYIENKFYKHHKVVPIYLYGFNKLDSIFVQKSIKSINTISRNLFLELVQKSDLSPQSGISVTLKINEQQDTDTQTEILNGKVDHMFKPKRYNSEIEISYKSGTEINKKYNVILKSIYKSLGPIETETFDKNWFTHKNDEIVISKKHTDILNTIYQDEFVDGFSIDELEDLINDL
jgi:hypothetical protein